MIKPLRPTSIFWLFCLAFGLTAVVAAEQNEGDSPFAPETIEGAVNVDAEGLIEMVQTKPDLVVIDARITVNRIHGYIEGSVSLPDVETDCNRLRALVPKLDTPTLFYCNGVRCGRSVKSVRKALTCGYRNLYWFRGGFAEWQAKGYPSLKD
jgi:rhodanese-related sulfurtransferase